MPAYSTVAVSFELHVGMCMCARVYCYGRAFALVIPETIGFVSANESVLVKARRVGFLGIILRPMNSRELICDGDMLQIERGAAALTYRQGDYVPYRAAKLAIVVKNRGPVQNCASTSLTHAHNLNPPVRSPAWRRSA